MDKILDKLPGDATIIVILIITSIVFGLVIGKSRIGALLIGLYIALGVISVTPEKFYFFSRFAELIIFTLFLVLSTVMSTQIFDVHIPWSGGRIPIGLFILSFLEAGMLLSIILRLIPSKFVLDYISRTTLMYFIDPIAQFVWVVLPLLFLFLLNRR